MVWDLIFARLSSFADLLAYEIERRTLHDWVFCFAPILLFLEIPRYYLPMLGVLAARALGHPKRRAGRIRELMHRPPLVSVVIAGRNEAATIDSAIRSVLDQDYPDFEVIVVDDSSGDDTWAIARRWERRGRIRLFRNSSPRGRSGRPGASNLGMAMARGEIIVSLDADTTHDRSMITRLVEGFADPRVGVVAGNLHCRNSGHNLLTRLQTLEYAVAIDLKKRWSDLLGCTLQASGAIQAFRRCVLTDVRGWDQELAEDTDVSLRIVQAGWRLAFAPDAVALTEVPTSLKVLTRQRHRWDRGGVRASFKKHWRMMSPRVTGWSFASELWAEFGFAVLATVVYPIYLLWLATHGLWLLLFVWIVMTAVNAALSLFALGVVSVVCTRLQNPLSLLGAALVTPFYKGYLRWVRLKALVYELLRLRYEGHLPARQRLGPRPALVGPRAPGGRPDPGGGRGRPSVRCALEPTWQTLRPPSPAAPPGGRPRERHHEPRTRRRDRDPGPGGREHGAQAPPAQAAVQLGALLGRDSLRDPRPVPDRLRGELLLPDPAGRAADRPVGQQTQARVLLRRRRHGRLGARGHPGLVHRLRPVGVDVELLLRVRARASRSTTSRRSRRATTSTPSWRSSGRPSRRSRSRSSRSPRASSRWPWRPCWWPRPWAAARASSWSAPRSSSSARP